MNEETDYKIDYKTAYENVMIANKMLEQDNERLNAILNNIHNYIEKMSYCEVIDNPKKELTRILTKEE